MTQLGTGRVVIVTGAGRGIGRGHTLEFARHGASVVVNDVGTAVDGAGTSSQPAAQVVEEIVALGGRAVANTDDVADWEGARRLVDQAIDTFGGLDVVVNNAGIVRDRVLVNLEEADWDAVIRVHLKGAFCPTRWAARYWRERSKRGETNDARVINTTSAAGLYGNAGQTNYSAAKAGLTGFTASAAIELARYGVTVNTIAPAGRTRMTEQVFQEIPKPDGFDPLDGDNVAPFVVWLGSPESRGVTGRVFEVVGGKVTVAEGWHRGPSFAQPGRLDASTLAPAVEETLAQAAPITRAGG